MKKVTFVFALILVSVINANAQNDTLKPVKGDWGFSLNISGLINDIKVDNNKDGIGNYMIFARHYLKDDQALRVGLALNYQKQNFFTSDSVSISSGNRALQEVDSTISRIDFSISLGLEKHLGENKRLDPYVGGEILIGRIGNTTTNSNLTITDITGTYKEQLIIQQDGGFYVGLGGIAGFNFFLTKNLSLGVEFAYALTYKKAGGDYSISDNITPVSGADINTFENGKDQSSETTLGATSTGGIMLSFFF
ncbi:MAG: hypothetical protein COX70_07140 [Flavobacteriales bacterium CG_4_10_14_0_2_um_filter_32_8]|nr:MAG: hypothetical protein COX70_07140 [Flavobacteriales bacterium CG_4_10_14_0_2_um_filter_32_8]